MPNGRFILEKRSHTLPWVIFTSYQDSMSGLLSSTKKRETSGMSFLNAGSNTIAICLLRKKLKHTKRLLIWQKRLLPDGVMTPTAILTLLWDIFTWGTRSRQKNFSLKQLRLIQKGTVNTSSNRF